ncbi:MAG: Smr/MutS family protein [Alphaproteobacteria bacterium]|nr:Smr/MutS family protein [Alphaproteobacteria bacterium]
MSGRSRGKPPLGKPSLGKPQSKTPITETGPETDTALFQRTMGGVQPLKKKRLLESSAQPDLATAKPIAGAKAKRRRAAPSVQTRPRTPQPALLSADGFAGVDKRTVERMRRGKLPIDARLDLHGSYQDAAQADLDAFISSCAATGCRVVLVITGKGSVREGGGILRRRLPDWLNQPACRPHVLAFATARPEHGGSGAFYVLLRRRRDGRT